ncbi:MULTISPECIES: hypothetical protein [Burkholderia]|uniref:hypothetical protein n=1 Tax=Burkholderia TaxID=32008 RepID=UPI0012699EAD|nr:MULTISPECIES: hypothetical protein [Burkholderia]
MLYQTAQLSDLLGRFRIRMTGRERTAGQSKPCGATRWPLISLRFTDVDIGRALTGLFLASETCPNGRAT